MRRTGKGDRRGGPGATGTALLVALASLAALAGLAAAGLLPRALPGLFLGASVITWLLYWRDKRAAQAGRDRTPETTLHTWALAGGWPGALLAQQQFRHKTSKLAFRRVFYLTVALNLALLALLASPPAAPLRATLDAGSARLAAAVADLPWQEWRAQAGAAAARATDAR